MDHQQIGIGKSQLPVGQLEGLDKLQGKDLSGHSVVLIGGNKVEIVTKNEKLWLQFKERLGGAKVEKLSEHEIGAIKKHLSPEKPAIIEKEAVAKKPIQETKTMPAIPSVPKDTPAVGSPEVARISNKVSQTFKTEVQAAAEHMQLQRMDAHMAEAAQRTGQLPQFQKLGGSANPVTKIQEGLYLEKSVIESPQVAKHAACQGLQKFCQGMAEINKEGSRNVVLNKIASSLSPPDAPPEEVRKVAVAIANGYKNNNLEQTLKQLYPNLSPETLSKAIQDGAQELSNRLRNDDAPSQRALLKTLTKEASPPNLDTVRTLYSKDEVISSIRVLGMTTFPERKMAGEGASPITPFLHQLGAKSSHMTAPELSTAIDQSSLKEFQKDYLKKTLFTDDGKVKNCREYVSTQECVIANPDSVGYIRQAAKASGVYLREFAFKLGAENTNEIKGGQLLKTLGLSAFVVPKSEQQFSNVEFAGEKAPKGIASSWLENSNLMLQDPASKTEEWGSIAQLRKNLDILTADLSEATPEQKVALEALCKYIKEVLAKKVQERIVTIPDQISELEFYFDRDNPHINDEKIKDTKKLQEFLPALLKVIDGDNFSPKTVMEKKADFEVAFKDVIASMTAADFSSASLSQNIRMHCFIDALFCSADSHMNQYMVKDGKVYNIDFARHLGPEYIGKEGQVFSALRSSLLDHPAASGPMTKEEVAQFKAVLEKFVEGKEGLKRQFVSQRQSAEGEQSIKNLQFDIENLKNLSQEALGDFREKVKTQYGIEVKAEELSSLQAELSPKLKQLLEEKKVACFEKIHPKAFEALEARVDSAMKYFTDCEARGVAPTMTEATLSMYPDLKIFMTVFGRMYSLPFGSLALSQEGYRPLQGIIDEAKAEGIATESEIKQMQGALANIQKKAQSSEMLATTMDISL